MGGVMYPDGKDARVEWCGGGWTLCGNWRSTPASATPACATVSEAEVEAAYEVFYHRRDFGGPSARVRAALEAAARVRAAPVQGAEPVATWVRRAIMANLIGEVDPRGVDAAVRVIVSNLETAAPPPDAQRAEIEAARRDGAMNFSDPEEIEASNQRAREREATIHRLADEFGDRP